MGIPERSGQSVPDGYKVGYETYLSPFTFRYGSPEMRQTWSQNNFWRRVRDVWIAVATVQHEAELVSDEQLADLKAHRDDLSVERIFALEKETGHDVAAAIREYSEKASLGGQILHQGLTSEDVLSNAETLQTKESLGLIRGKLVNLLGVFAGQIDHYKDLVCMGYTHFQAAEPTTLGYRLSRYAQDLLVDLNLLDNANSLIKAKGIKGAVGTSASFAEILEGTGMTPQEQERKVMAALGLEAVAISDQTYPRKFLFLTANVLGNIGLSLHRFALDLQLLQSSPFDEVAEPRRRGQIGSSAMPHKQNPINSENINSLTEMMAGLQSTAWITASFTTLERTLRDSAGKRSWLPEGFLIIDEALGRTQRVVSGLVVRETSIRTNLERFAPFCVTEIILGKLVQAGMDRKKAHEILVGHAETAVEETRMGRANPMRNLLLNDERVVSRLGRTAVETASEEIFTHVGDAPKRCVEFLKKELYPAIGKKEEK